MQKIYRYYPEDFGELSVKVVHMDLLFDMFDDHTKVTSDLKLRTLDKPIDEIELNCKNLEVLSVSCRNHDIDHEYRKKDSILLIRFAQTVPQDTEILITTRTICRPTRNILEGLYYDETPAGAPPQQITQCQQWGFQRIVPCIDDMTAKCTYTTTIIADERYTNLITNGDTKETRQPVGNGRDRIVYDNSITPMAPYLFFLGVGTYDTFKREFEYPDGHTFDLELLVPPGSDPLIAKRALDVLYDSIMWVHLFTGSPEIYGRSQERRKIMAMVKERDRLKGEPDVAHEQLKKIRADLKKAAGSIQTGYRYTGTVYREIGMQNSNFGGMENVGNTTITTNRIMPFPQMTDGAFEYMIRVKVHEFYHNLNGSEVTGKSPFELWLNEAVTVHIERMYHAYHFGEGYSRLEEVLELLAPGSGTFALDRGAASMPIIPDGFNDPDDLITSVTYVKAPEFVSMIETLIGKETFARALNVYFSRYKHSNASSWQWIEVMEEVSGKDLKEMTRTWLKQTQFPVVHVRSAYDEKDRTCTLSLEQEVPEGAKFWEFPFRAALADKEGNELSEVMELVKGREKKIVFTDVEKPAFLSLNRGYSFFGKVVHDAGIDELVLQVRKDRDLINRFIAFYKIVDMEKMKMIGDTDSVPSKEFTDLYHELIRDHDLMGEAGAQFLTIFESVEDEKLAHRYQLLYEIKQKLLKAVANRHEDSLISIYRLYNDRKEYNNNDYVSGQVHAIKDRQVKNRCLAVLATLDTPRVHDMVREQFKTAQNATDKLSAFSYYLDSSAPDRMQLMKAFQKQAEEHPVSWEAFLRVIGSISRDDVFDLVRQVESSGAFRIEQANDQRALYGSFAANRKRSLQTEKGRKLLTDIVLKLAEVNEYSTVNILNVLANIDRMEDEYHMPLVEMMVGFLDRLDPDRTPSVYNRIRKILLNTPNAVKKYEAVNGKINLG
ncbi:MAG: Tricorn protease-interacting factor F2 [Methanomethylovorans sp. PtaU1.Bin093]|uniref:M1 family metallopeptidase n=1 Tax=Methanomethylovorans sp. PtaU1.Bin093 TaxID=1811679 RepID=UPI0009CD301B|nr:M1 family metallopeptidase [Methanomethylovorans sp. PtaU1.Bin093]OPY18492.1 MAG: Tricorn protease-interacting factor F2 [Methanomethylovorans sp. PtaU1.Bin093]